MFTSLRPILHLVTSLDVDAVEVIALACFQVGTPDAHPNLNLVTVLDVIEFNENNDGGISFHTYYLSHLFHADVFSSHFLLYTE